ncbi:MAG TPA: NAD-dependent deacylase [Vicinamibacterales bacterium]|nr:NAD-dependent deacylase [Vicinamibacterales bacterium]
METLERVGRRIRAGASVTVLTGAGVSAPSGVPTFRGDDGLWRRYRPEVLATPEAFARDPRLVWAWYDWRRRRIAGCEPNAAHRVLAAWSHRLPRFTLVTQNVDGLHERAGTRNVIRFHGTLWQLRCAGRCPGSPAAWPDDRVPLPELPPRCPWCGGLARPDVVWFGEPIEPGIMDAALAALACDVFLAIGTSAVVQPAASLLGEARRHGAFVVEINVEGTPATALADAVLRGSADDILPRLDAYLD